MRKAIIDGDLLTYAVGFASNSKQYKVAGYTFRYKKDAVEWCLEHGVDKELIEKEEVEEPIEFVLANAKRLINKIQHATDAEDYVIYLSGDTNYRKDAHPDYKANRNNSNKPKYFNEIKDYLIQQHDAIVTDGIEADDAMAMAADPHQDVICTLDKDLDTVCGWRYNWKKDELYFVEFDEADRFFWMQMLMGDPADNIKGIPGIGPKTAENIMTLGEEEGTARRCIVGNVYAKHFDDPEQEYIKNAMLLFIMR